LTEKNLDIVLTAEGHKYILSELFSPNSTQIKNATEIQIKYFEDWIKVDEMAQ